MISDSDYANSITALFEMQRRVIRIAFPQGIFFAGEFWAARGRASKCFQKRRSVLPVTAGLLTSRREGSRELLRGRAAGVRPQRNRRQSDDPIPSFRAGE